MVGPLMYLTEPLLEVLMGSNHHEIAPQNINVDMDWQDPGVGGGPDNAAHVKIAPPTNFTISSPIGSPQYFSTFVLHRVLADGRSHYIGSITYHILQEEAPKFVTVRIRTSLFHRTFDAFINNVKGGYAKS